MDTEAQKFRICYVIGFVVSFPWVLYRYGPVSVCLGVSLSVTSRCYIEVVGRIELRFGTEAFLTSPTLCLKEI